MEPFVEAVLLKSKELTSGGWTP